MGKLSYDDKLRIQMFREQGLGAKAVMSSYRDYKGWKLSVVKKVCSRIDSTGQWPITSFPLSRYSALLFPAEQSKFETIKMMGARDKINAISLNVKINKRKSVHICGYKLPINERNSVQKDSAQAKISLKVVGGGATYLTHPVYSASDALCSRVVP